LRGQWNYVCTLKGLPLRLPRAFQAALSRDLRMGIASFNPSYRATALTRTIVGEHLEHESIPHVVARVIASRYSGDGVRRSAFDLKGNWR
jgi:hypothetical protein